MTTNDNETTARSGDHTSQGRSEASPSRLAPRKGHWYAEYLPDGTERHWADHARDYTEGEDDRARLAEAITATRWYRRDEPLPMSHGLLLKEVAQNAGLRPVAFGISDLPLDFPEAAYLDHDRESLDPDLFETLAIVAIAAAVGPTVLVTYFLDRGDKAVPLALELRRRSQSEDRSLACDVGFDRLCRGRFKRGSQRGICRCECHRVATAIAGAA